MPAALVKSIADDTGIDLAEAEKRWKKAKAITEQETGLNEGDGESFWKYVTGVFKKSMGIGVVMETADIKGIVHANCIEPYLGKPHVNTLLEAALPFDPNEPWRVELDEAMNADFIMESAKKNKDPNFKPWKPQPSIVGRLKGKALEEVRALGFDSDESPVMLPGNSIVHIMQRHGNELSEDDGKYLRLAIENPDEVLPNKGKSLPGGGKDFYTVHREKSVLMVHRADKDYLVIVEVGPKDGTNIVWSFWKMGKANANNYLAPSRQDKARILQSGGATVHIPHIPPVKDGGKPEGLSGSQIESTGSETILPNDNKPVKPITESATAEEVHAAAHEAATSHLNDLPEPTEAMKSAGNYKKGKFRIHGLEIVCENPKGSTRSGVDPNGKPWQVEMPAHYCYFSKTEAADGDHVDCYLGDHPESELVFVIDQCDAETGRYDEAKCILGCLSQKEARDLYIAGFSDGKGAKRLGAMTAMHMPDFKEWLKNGETKKPISEAVMESAEKQPQEMTRNEFNALPRFMQWAYAAKAGIVKDIRSRTAGQEQTAHKMRTTPGGAGGDAAPETFYSDSRDLYAEIVEASRSYRTAIQSATSLADIEAVFRGLWPGIIRLTNNQSGDKVKASENGEGAMKYEVEVTRSNVTVAEFFAAIKTACTKKGVDFSLDRDVFENPSHPSNDTYFVRDGIKYARYGDGEPTREYDGSDTAAKAETSRVKPYDYQAYILNHDGSAFNEICEFAFDTEKRGHGYYYQMSRDAAVVKEPEAPAPADMAPTALAVFDTLLSHGWVKSDSVTAIAMKGYPSIIGERKVYAYLSEGDEYNQTLSGSFYQGNDNLLSAHSALIPKPSTQDDVTQLANEFANDVEKVVGDYFTIRLAR